MALTAVTVRRGEAWKGERPGGEPPDAAWSARRRGARRRRGRVVAADAEARRVVEEARRPAAAGAGGRRPVPHAGRAGRPRPLRARRCVAPVDLGSVLVDGRQFWFVAHLVARRSWWRGRMVAAMNAQFLGAWDVAPQAHPGDGLLDVVDVAAGLSLVDRLRRGAACRSGGHVPHPADRGDPAPRPCSWSSAAPTPVWLDGEPVGEARNLSLRLEPDALTSIV